jgi:ABC-type multidrug transport system ATPase subunit
VAKLVGGLEPSALGQVLVGGRDPGRDPLLRAHVGVTLEVPALPAAGRVGDYLQQVALLRRDQAAPERALQVFGLSHWQGRRMGALSRAEMRALELAVAATTADPFALALTEPGADIAPYDRQALRDLLFRAAENGACVMIMTASTNDAVELAATIHVMERGRITRWVPVDESGALVPGRGVALRVEADLPRLLVATLADDPAVSGLDWSPDGHRSVLSVRGEDLDQLALAVARAAVDSGVNVRAITPAAPALDEVRAAASGLALAAYHAAYGAYYTYHGQQGTRPASGSSRSQAAPNEAPAPSPTPPPSAPPPTPPKGPS